MHYGDEIVTAQMVRNQMVTVNAGKRTSLHINVSSWDAPSGLIIPVDAEIMYYSGSTLANCTLPAGLYATGCTLGWQVGYNRDLASLQCVIYVINTSSTNVTSQTMNFVLRVTWRRCALDTRVHYD